MEPTHIADTERTAGMADALEYVRDGLLKPNLSAEYVASSMQKMDDPYAIGRAVQKAIQDSTDATNGDVGAFLRSLREQGYCVRQSDGQAGDSGVNSSQNEGTT